MLEERSGAATGQADRAGLTIVELVVVIVTIGILAVVALPRLVHLADEAHTAKTAAVSGALESTIDLVHSKWRAQGGGTTVSLEGTTVEVGSTGWPVGTGGPPMTESACAALWNDLLASAPPIGTSFVPGRKGWGTLAAGDYCVWVFETDTNPIRVILYNSATGVTTYLVV